MAKKEKKDVEETLEEVGEIIEMSPEQALDIAAPKGQKTLEMLVSTGIPVETCVFHAAIANADGSPESRLTATGNNASRRAKMWWTPHTLICWQKGIYFGTPLANVISVKFL